jgi:hypothetical protein
MKLNFVKWKLMLTTLPITLVIVLIKYLLMDQFGYAGVVKYSEISLVVTGGIFLIGFMLAGTMADYKESERLPSELACAIETIEDTLHLAHNYKGGFDLAVQKAKLHTVSNCILKWFRKECTTEDAFEHIQGITEIALVLEKAGVGAIASRVSGEQHNLRKVFSRVNVIRNTNFLATGYAFLEVLTVVIIGLLLVSQFENLLISMIIVSFVTQIFIYMIRLIKDIDQPFEYSANGTTGAADIDLFPLTDYIARAAKRV